MSTSLNTKLHYYCLCCVYMKRLLWLLHPSLVSRYAPTLWGGMFQQSTSKAPVCGRYPGMRLPSHVTFQRLDDRLREIGFLKPTRWGTGRPCKVWTARFEKAVLQQIEENISISKRAIANNSIPPTLMCGTSCTRWTCIHSSFRRYKTHQLMTFRSA